MVVLTAPDAAGLHALLERARDRDITTTAFREPDLGDELTAVAFTPSAATRKLLANLPLAGRRQLDQQPLLEREAALRELSGQMRRCEQTAGQDVLAHGRSVREHYFALLDHLAGRVDLHASSNWRLPAWVDDYAGHLLTATLPRHLMDRYLTLHDAGKPSVHTQDPDGRVHFPGHAAASEQVYRDTCGPWTPDQERELIAALIGGDMDIHLLKAEQIPQFAERQTAVAHLLAGLSEVHSNAGLFGGTTSTSFKIKAKHLDKRGRTLCRYLLFGEPTQLTNPPATRPTTAHHLTDGGSR